MRVDVVAVHMKEVCNLKFNRKHHSDLGFIAKSPES